MEMIDGSKTCAGNELVIILFKQKCKDNIVKGFPSRIVCSSFRTTFQFLSINCTRIETDAEAGIYKPEIRAWWTRNPDNVISRNVIFFYRILDWCC